MDGEGEVDGGASVLNYTQSKDNNAKHFVSLFYYIFSLQVLALPQVLHNY